jgi:hypothetical protein
MMPRAILRLLLALLLCGTAAAEEASDVKAPSGSPAGRALTNDLGKGGRPKPTPSQVRISWVG